MPITVSSFTAAASATRLSSRDLLIGTGNGGEVRLGHVGRWSVTASRKDANDQTLSAFRQALENEYGMFGAQAFDASLAGRAGKHLSLRAQDVRKVVSDIAQWRATYLDDEISRQAETHPDFIRLSPEAKSAVLSAVKDEMLRHSDMLQVAGGPIRSQTDMAGRVADSFSRHAVQLSETADRADTPQLPEAEATALPTTPTGLLRFKELRAAGDTHIRGNETSAEDRVRSHTLAPGMRINRDTPRPIVFERLKNNGVEPGFIFRNDWAAGDSAALMCDTFDAHLEEQLVDSARNFASDPDVRQSLQLLDSADAILQEVRHSTSDATTAEQMRRRALCGMACALGRQHPAATAFAAEYVIHRALTMIPGEGSDGVAFRNLNAEPSAAAWTANVPWNDQPEAMRMLCESLQNHRASDFFPQDDTPQTDAQKAALNDFKRTHFAQIRDAVMHLAPGDPLASTAAFRHFSDRHISKLDYNEGDRLDSDSPLPGSQGSFRLPKRVEDKYWYGAAYRRFRLTTADEASTGAVAEALANDLTRLAGVPAQELSIVRGEYSDGHTKLMLDAKFAKGYRDFDNYCLKDGRIAMPEGSDVKPEPLGRYKAFFLLLADRDAIGSHGQNKGLVNGQFFAIDPGHSLEGNGEKLEIRDNFSFKDKGGKFYEKRFRNYSVFDDDTRAAKLKGLADLRDCVRNGAIANLFRDYRETFDPESAAENDRALHTSICTRIDAMEQELTSQMDRMLRIFGPQLEVYDGLGAFNAGLPEEIRIDRDAAIETIENLERQTSPTTKLSANGKVELNHLEVIESTRTPWTAELRDGNLIYTAGKPLTADAMRDMRSIFADASLFRDSGLGAPAEIVFESDTETGSAQITVPLERANDFFAAFAEAKVEARKNAAAE